MILAINTSSEQNSIALFEKDKISSTKSWLGYKNQSRDLLMEIDKILKKNKKVIQDIAAIGVYRGPGSYTGLRVGISVANALGWSLDIPVIGIKGASEDLSALGIAEATDRKLKMTKSKKFQKIVTPFYPKLF